MAANKTYTSLYLDRDLLARAKELAARRQRSFNEYLIMLMERDLREVDRRKQTAEKEATHATN